MGSNMQRQAVPLLVTEPPLVGTGMEKDVATQLGMVVRAQRGRHGHVRRRRADQSIGQTSDEYVLRKFHGLNERTCLNQTPIVKIGQKVKKGQIIADGAATHQGELALGRNVLVAFMSWDGYNFEDAIIISERLVKDDIYTSIHIEEFDIEIRETKLGKEEFTRDIPNVSPKALRNLDEHGIVRVGTCVEAGRHPRRQGVAEEPERTDAGREAAARDLRPGRRRREERLARSAVGRRRASSSTPQRFSRRANMTEDERKEHRSRKKRRIDDGVRGEDRVAVPRVRRGPLRGDRPARTSRTRTGKALAGPKDDDKDVAAQARAFRMDALDIRTPGQDRRPRQKLYTRHWERIQFFIDEQERKHELAQARRRTALAACCRW